jgi:hypothetical protein
VFYGDNVYAGARAELDAAVMISTPYHRRRATATRTSASTSARELRGL